MAVSFHTAAGLVVYNLNVKSFDELAVQVPPFNEDQFPGWVAVDTWYPSDM